MPALMFPPPDALRFSRNRQEWWEAVPEAECVRWWVRSGRRSGSC